jgi:hypothetical protein
MLASRIRFQADQIRLATNVAGAGQLIFGPGIVNGVMGTVLDSAFIGDVTIDTIQLQNGSVTLPATYRLAQAVAPAPGSASTTFVTFFEDEFVVRGTVGSNIYLQYQADIVTSGQDTQPAILPIVRLLRNGVQVDGWTAPGSIERRVRSYMEEIPATGGDQSFSLEWQVRSNSSGFTFPGVLTGSSFTRIAMKR